MLKIGFRLYGFIQGNVTKKDLDFNKIVYHNFDRHVKIEKLIDLVTSGKLSPLNAKEVAYIIIDGDLRLPEVIASEKGMLG